MWIQVVFTALAFVPKRSEIHALSCSHIQFIDQSVYLLTFIAFCTKNQLPSVLSDPISMPSLSGEDVNPLLYTGRALRIYLDRVLQRRKGRKRLFISNLDSNEKESSCNTISHRADHKNGL